MVAENTMDEVTITAVDTPEEIFKKIADFLNSKEYTIIVGVATEFDENGTATHAQFFTSGKGGDVFSLAENIYTKILTKIKEG